MTLKEKISDSIFYIEPKSTIILLEKIAEEFAVGFAKFSINYNYDPIHEIWIRYDERGNEIFGTKQLLEIYKKTL